MPEAYMWVCQGWEEMRAGTVDWDQVILARSIACLPNEVYPSFLLISHLFCSGLVPLGTVTLSQVQSLILISLWKQSSTQSIPIASG